MIRKIVTDSSSNMLTLPGANFATVPLKIITEAAEYVDDAGLDVAAMVDDLRTVKGKTGTSCPNVGEWLDAFEGADEVFAVTISKNLSGSYASAMQAKEEYEATHPGAKVYIIDSLSAGPELRMFAEFVLRGFEAEKTFEEIVEGVEAYHSNTETVFCLQSLANLARNGRVNPAVAKITNVLGIRVVGIASDVGTLQPTRKPRGEKKAMEAIYEQMLEKGYKGSEVCISHCLYPQGAQLLTDLIHKHYPDAVVRTEPCTGLCSFYAEMGGLIIGYTNL